MFAWAGHVTPSDKFAEHFCAITGPLQPGGYGVIVQHETTNERPFKVSQGLFLPTFRSSYLQGGFLPAYHPPRLSSPQMICHHFLQILAGPWILTPSFPFRSLKLQVKELMSGRQWWYKAEALKLVSREEVCGRCGSGSPGQIPKTPCRHHTRSHFHDGAGTSQRGTCFRGHPRGLQHCGAHLCRGRTFLPEGPCGCRGSSSGKEGCSTHRGRCHPCKCHGDCGGCRIALRRHISG